MTKGGQPIQSLRVKHSVTTGILIGSQFAGTISAYEEREAARFGFYNWTEWRLLNKDEKAMAVAHYRINGMISLHQQDAVNDEMERRNKQKR